MKLFMSATRVVFVACVLSSASFGLEDSDSDGLIDSWEQHFGLDPLDATDANSDVDQDGFTALTEFLHGGSPLNTDVGSLPDYYVYADGLLNEWWDKSPTSSWVTHERISGDLATQIQADLHSTQAVYSGNYALAMVPDRWRFLNLIHSNIDISYYENLEFYIHGGSTGGQVLKVVLLGSTYQDSPQYRSIAVNDYVEGGAVVANAWRKVSIPLSDLTDDISVISRVNIGWPNTGVQSLYYLDEIKFTAPHNRPRIRITVDPQTVVGRFDHDLLGSNGGYWVTNMHNDDMVERVIHSGINNVRYPGGNLSDSFHWQDWNHDGVEDWITTPDDYFQFLANSGSRGVITANFGTGTAQEAADWVSYALQQGADVPIWEIGNEIYGNWQPSPTHAGNQYMNGGSGYEGAKDYCALMKAANPEIKVSMVGTLSKEAYSGFGKKAAENADDCFDFYTIHYYTLLPTQIDYHTLLNAAHADMPIVTENVHNMLALNPLLADTEIALTEYNSYSSEPELLAIQTVNMLFLADVIGQAALGGITQANQWFLGGIPSDNYYSLLLDYMLYSRAPSYYVFPLWNKMGDELLQVSTNKNAANEVAVYASRHSDTGDLSLLVINKTHETQKATIDLGMFTNNGDAYAFEAAGADLNSQSVTYNGYENPTDLLALLPPMETKVKKNVLKYHFKPYSVTVVRFEPESPE